MFNSMKEAEDFIYASYLKASKFVKGKKDEETRNIGLARKLLDAIGSPDRGQAFILVTGSKGKGSTSRLIASLLSHAGLRVGLFTSPHLVQFNERIRINGKAISDEDFIRLSNRIAPFASSIEHTLTEQEYQGPIGLTLAIASLYFKEQGTDINVIECGRGGAFDETNIIENEWAVITPIMKEHTQYLGPELEDIARHKLGIVKPGTKHVYVSDQKDNLGLIKALIPEDNILSLSCYNEDFLASEIAAGSHGTSFTVRTEQHVYERLELPLLGSFQAINAATAVRVCEDIVKEKLDEALIRQSFRTIQWPGRMEVIARFPAVVLDGAINRESAKYVTQWVKAHQWKRIVSIIGVPSDKDYKGVIEEMTKISKQIILAKPDITHLQFPVDAYSFAETVADKVEETEFLAEAVELANKEEADAILIIGTQTLLANAKRLWNQTLDDIGL